MDSTILYKQRLITEQLFEFMLHMAKENKEDTGKSFSETLFLASTKPQYDKRLFVELRVQYMKTTSSEHVVYRNCFVLTFKTIYVHNMF